MGRRKPAVTDAVKEPINDQEKPEVGQVQVDEGKEGAVVTDAPSAPEELGENNEPNKEVQEEPKPKEDEEDLEDDSSVEEEQEEEQKAEKEAVVSVLGDTFLDSFYKRRLV